VLGLEHPAKNSAKIKIRHGANIRFKLMGLKYHRFSGTRERNFSREVAKVAKGNIMQK
jgi:hypothetical protein